MKILTYLSRTCSLGLLVLSGTIYGHAGSYDQNGGHYYGRSYHCHMRGCEMPDTFNRIGRDSFFYDQNDRDKFFNSDDWDWEQDYDRDCQSTRQEILILTSTVPVKYTNPRNCIVRTGRWVDEYTGKIFEVATQIDIDHIIPVEYAHRNGGDRWPPEKKLSFANDPVNLILVEKREIRKKRDKGPSRYLPREEYHCSYARQWLAISDKYKLTLNRKDKNKITLMLRDCAD